MQIHPPSSARQRRKILISVLKYLGNLVIAEADKTEAFESGDTLLGEQLLLVVGKG